MFQVYKEKNLIDKTSKLRNKARNELLKNLNLLSRIYGRKKIRMVIDKKSIIS